MRYLIIGLLVLGAGPLMAQDDRTTPSTSFGIVTVADAMTTLLTLIDQPAPATLSPEDRAAYQKHSGRRQYAPIRLTKAIELVRTAVVKESVRFTTLSNVLKTRHESAMNAIRNMK